MTIDRLPDDVIARQVREAVDALNCVITYAHEAGLVVTPTLIDCTRINDRNGRDVITVRLFREL